MKKAAFMSVNWVFYHPIFTRRNVIMQEITTTTVSFPSTGSRNALSEVLRHGAQRLLAEASRGTWPSGFSPTLRSRTKQSVGRVLRTRLYRILTHPSNPLCSRFPPRRWVRARHPTRDPVENRRALRPRGGQKCRLAAGDRIVYIRTRASGPSPKSRLWEASPTPIQPSTTTVSGVASRIRGPQTAPTEFLGMPVHRRP